MKVEISVIICTYNGANLIRECLNSLKNQKTLHNFEVIIIDDGSTDNIKEIVNLYPFRIISNKQNLGLAQSRNIGIKHAKGNIIAFTDDDCIPEINWVDNICNEFKKDENLIGLSGKVTSFEVHGIILRYIDFTKPLTPLPIELLHSTNIIYRLFLYIKKQFTLSLAPKYNDHIVISSVVGANMAFRKEVLNSINGFDPIFKFGGEEEELCYRLMKLRQESHFVLKYISSIHVKHKFNNNFFNLLKKHYLYGMGNARIKQKHTERSFSLFPFPFIIIFCFLTGLILIELNTLSLLLIPIIFYFHWIILAIKMKDLRFYIFPFLQFFVELSNNVGWLKQYFKLLF